MKQKLKISDLVVSSFITVLERKYHQTLNGGVEKESDRCPIISEHGTCISRIAEPGSGVKKCTGEIPPLSPKSQACD